MRTDSAPGYVPAADDRATLGLLRAICEDHGSRLAVIAGAAQVPDVRYGDQPHGRERLIPDPGTVPTPAVLRAAVTERGRELGADLTALLAGVVRTPVADRLGDGDAALEQTGAGAGRRWLRARQQRGTKRAIGPGAGGILGIPMPR